MNTGLTIELPQDIENELQNIEDQELRAELKNKWKTFFDASVNELDYSCEEATDIANIAVKRTIQRRLKKS